MRWPALRVAAKVRVSVAVLVVATFGIAAVAGLSLRHAHAEALALSGDELATTQQTAAMGDALDGIGRAALLHTQTTAPAERARLDAALNDLLVPAGWNSAAAVRVLVAGNQGELRTLDAVKGCISSYRQLQRLDGSPTDPPSSVTDPSLAPQITAVFDRAAALTRDLQGVEARQAERSRAALNSGYHRALALLGGGAAAALLLAMAVTAALRRDLVPRIGQCVQLATEAAAGSATGRFAPAGHDEVTDLAAALNDMVAQRDLVTAQEAVAAVRDRRQAEFIDTLQLTSTEDEAHELLQRHLQRSLPGSAAVVLQRNNSANRLAAVTPLEADSDILARLVGAEPRWCLALRIGRTHVQGGDADTLLNCTICSNRELLSTCEPLLVGGEVIGAVLVSHPGALSPSQSGQIASSVGQAAPVLANLRNVALSEFRANNDSLTGLPNKRATDDTLKRMVAQATRSLNPLSAIMLDLDHFKQINDRFGHGRGDEVLAAVGAGLQSCLRAGDFAGRFGGEEFLVLLPDTGVSAALQVAEKLRRTVATIVVPGVERDITVSLGVAGLLEHAGNASGLLQQADQALYAAKAAGRNRAVAAEAEVGSADRMVTG